MPTARFMRPTELAFQRCVRAKLNNTYSTPRTLLRSVRRMVIWTEMMTMTPTKHDDPWSQLSAHPSLFVGSRFDGCHALAVYWVRDGDGSPGLVFRGMDVSAVPSKPPKFRNMSIHVSCGEDGRMETRLFLRAQD